jgi:nicotinate-nucleotide adenylyltransferase
VHQQFPGDKVVLIIGGDSLRDLPMWHDPGTVLAEADELGVVRRPDDEADLSELEQHLPGLAAKVHFIDAPLLEIASHEIRQRVQSGRPFRYYVPQAVLEYIIRNHLYQQT